MCSASAGSPACSLDRLRPVPTPATVRAQTPARARSEIPALPQEEFRQREAPRKLARRWKSLESPNRRHHRRRWYLLDRSRRSPLTLVHRMRRRGLWLHDRSRQLCRDQRSGAGNFLFQGRAHRAASRRLQIVKALRARRKAKRRTCGRESSEAARLPDGCSHTPKPGR